MRSQQHADPETLRFRGATLDEAIELAEQSLGPRTRVVAANHIRRGGIGGFFASDLGVEVSVVLDDEAIEQALDRIVEETAIQERKKWRDSAALRQEQFEPRLHDSAPVALTSAAAEIRPSASSFAAALRRVDESLVAGSVESSIESSIEIAIATPVPVELEVAAPGPAAAGRGTSLGSRLERLEAAFASLRAGDALVPARVPTPVRNAVTSPTRRQVELVVAAADQLIDSIARRADTEQMSVRVVLRGSTGAEVEAEAHWGSKDEVQ